MSTLLLAALLGIGSPTEGDEVAPVLALDWDAPAGCPDAQALTERVAGMVARPLTAADASNLEIRGYLSPQPQSRFALELTVVTNSGSGVRTFEGSDCDVLTDTAALVIAAALEEPLPEEEPKEETRPVAPLPACAPGPAPVCPVAPQPAAPLPVAPELGGSVVVGGAAAVGPLPGLAGGPALQVALRRRNLRLAASFDYLFPRRTTGDASDGAADIQGWTLGGRACWAPAVPRAEFPICGGMRAGVLRADGVGLDAPQSTRLPWVSATAGAAVVVLPWPFFGFWIGADALVSVTRPGFFRDEGQLLHRVPSITGAALLGAEARFGAGSSR